MAKDAEYLGLKPDSRNFTVVYDKFKLAAHIHSAALAMPRDDTPMTLRIDKGVRAARGGNETKDKLEAVVTIPGRVQPAFLGRADDAGGQRALRAGADSAADQFVAGGGEGAGGKGIGCICCRCGIPKQPKEDKEPYNWDDESQIGQGHSRAVPARCR